MLGMQRKKTIMKGRAKKKKMDKRVRFKKLLKVKGVM